MAESGGSNRFDVELTSNDGAPEWARPEAGEGDSEGGSGGSAPAQVLESSPVGQAPSPEWRRVLGVGAVAVAALALGWMLGRSEDSNDISADEPKVTTNDSADTIAPASDVIAAVEPVVSSPASSPASSPGTAPAVTPTTMPRSIGESTTELVALAVSVKGMPTEIVALAGGRRIITLDLSIGSLETRVIDSQPFGPPTLFVGEDLVLLPSWDEDLPSTLLRDGADPESVDVGPAPRLLSAQGSGVLWRSDLAPVGFGAARSEPVSLDGTPLGEALELPAFPGLADPAGGVVVAASGAVFQVTPGGVAEITPGRLVAIGPDHAIGHECDDVLVCRYVFIERATGSRSALPLGPALGEQPFFDTGWGPVSVSAFSSDGAFVALEWAGVETEFQRTLVVLDVRSGAIIELGADPDSVQYTWSSDRRVLFYLLGGRLSVLDVATGESDLVTDDLFGVETFALRPLTP